MSQQNEQELALVQELDLDALSSVTGGGPIREGWDAGKTGAATTSRTAEFVATIATLLRSPG
jgi:hypothetical protein